MGDSTITAQPVRTATNGDVVAYLADGTTNTQLLKINTDGSIYSRLYDASGNAITSQISGAQRALDVGINVAGVQVDPRQIRALTASDIVTAAQGSPNSLANAWPFEITDGTHGPVAVKAASTAAAAADSALVVSLSPNSPIPAGSAIIGKVEITDGTNVGGVTAASTAAAATQPAQVVALSPNSPVPAGTNTIGSVNQGTANTIANAWPVKLTDGTNTAAIAAASTAAASTQSAVVVAFSPNSPVPAGTNAIGSVLANLQVASAPVTSTNPVPVTVVSSVPGTNIQSYFTSVSLAIAASVTFTYTVATGHTFNLMRVWASASGAIRADVKNNGTTIFTGFNTASSKNIDMTIVAPPLIAAGNTVTVTITNEDIKVFDVFATIEGNQN